MNENELLIIKKFIPVFIKIQNELFSGKVKIEQPILLTMFSGLTEIENKRQLYIKEHAPHFNIFNIMRYGHYETRLHTPFLVHLLTPNGHHQLGFQFFNLFIEHIFMKTFDVSEIKNYQIFEEFTDRKLEGQIDIYIQFLYKSDLYYIVIENKINANDQVLQLQRYYDFLKSKIKKRENARLIYLTKYGSQPSTPFSINPITYNELKNEGILKLLSYKDEIASWVKNLLDGKPPKSVKEILRQYLNSIK